MYRHNKSIAGDRTLLYPHYASKKRRESPLEAKRTYVRNEPVYCYKKLQADAATIVNFVVVES